MHRHTGLFNFSIEHIHLKVTITLWQLSKAYGLKLQTWRQKVNSTPPPPPCPAFQENSVARQHQPLSKRRCAYWRSVGFLPSRCRRAGSPILSHYRWKSPATARVPTRLKTVAAASEIRTFPQCWIDSWKPCLPGWIHWVLKIKATAFNRYGEIPRGRGHCWIAAL